MLRRLMIACALLALAFNIVVPLVAMPAPPPSAPRPDPPIPDAAALRDAYAARLWHPIAARRPIGIHLSGVVVLAFAVDDEGRLRGLAIRSGSGNAMFDRLALRTVERSEPLPAPPREIAGMPRIFTIRFSFD